MPTRKTKVVEPEISARDRLKKLAGKKEPTSSKKKDDRPVLSVGEDDETRVVGQAVDRLTACVHLKKAVEGHEKAARAIVLPWARDKTLRAWVDNGTKTENIKIATKTGSSFILQVKDTLTGARGFRVPKEDGEPIDVETHLRNNGVNEQLISRLIAEQEFIDEQVMTIPMAKLEKENKELADKLIDLILAANEGGVTTNSGKKIKFTDAEMSSLVEQAHDVTIKEDFLSRVTAHVKAITNNEEEQVAMLDGILSAIPPQFAVGSVVPGLKEEDVLRDMMNEKEVLPSPIPVKPVDHPAGENYTLRVSGLEIAVIRKSDNKELCKKICHDGAHVANTLKKWQREPAALTAFIAERA